MQRSVPKTIKLFCLGFVFTFFMVSCQKENYDITKEEVVENIVPKMKITIGSRTIERNAYATYCNANGKIFFNVSNNQDLLDSALLSSDFMVDDFLINYEKEGTQVSAFGGATFTENIGGTDVTTVVFDPAATITITEANDQLVKGSMTGVFQLPSGNQASYSVEFTARVVAVSPWCN